ncbi:DUF1593 domain-containing protein [Catalinimonas niigatensis]|uniref:DUF1593 domain-containing protein n=1 Tax=Catalinimonas niigatensis TaxID=1397264 RepID=UPI002666FACF|nr:DUF1593 domain-containing protein [Catalinimonas niigatensis]WPP49370.1 DUF1593 domain-containing protein [Catalinimonas niigatensis]
MQYLLFLFLLLPYLSICQTVESNAPKSRVIVSTDIGGSDPDDYQSMVHFLVYSDRFDIEGLISSPPHEGRKKHIEEVLDAYAKDYPQLSQHGDFPTTEELRHVTKQGAVDSLTFAEPTELSEGAEWIIRKAKEDEQPLYVLVWGSITDVAQAVHADPAIKKNLRVYSIGSWNTRLDPNSRDYLYQNHPDLWWVENNTTFRGMYMGGIQEGAYENTAFVEKHVKGHGALGDLFWEKKKDIKMGDTPSVLYMLSGDPSDPTDESWGGTFIKTTHGTHYWADDPKPELVENERSGAKTVNRHRQAYLDDWAKRMDWTLKKQ